MIISFCGARGVGKSTIAKTITKRLNDISPGMGIVVNGIFEKIIQNHLTHSWHEDTRQICGAGIFINEYLDAIEKDNPDSYIVFSRSLFDLFAYWKRGDVVGQIVKDLYVKNPVDFLINIRVDTVVNKTDIEKIGSGRGYNPQDFLELVKYENTQIARRVVDPSYSNTYKKLLIVNNDYKNDTLNDLIKTIFRMI